MGTGRKPVETAGAPDAPRKQADDEIWRKAARGITISVLIAIPIWVGLILLLIRLL